MDVFQSGNIVKIKSGGPKMTIIKVDNYDCIYCRWFDKNDNVQSARFHKDELIKEEN